MLFTTPSYLILCKFQLWLGIGSKRLLSDSLDSFFFFYVFKNDVWIHCGWEFGLTTIRNTFHPILLSILNLQMICVAQICFLSLLFIEIKASHRTAGKHRLTKGVRNTYSATTLSRFQYTVCSYHEYFSIKFLYLTWDPQQVLCLWSLCSLSNMGCFLPLLTWASVF